MAPSHDRYRDSTSAAAHIAFAAGGDVLSSASATSQKLPWFQAGHAGSRYVAVSRPFGTRHLKLDWDTSPRRCAVQKLVAFHVCKLFRVSRFRASAKRKRDRAMIIRPNFFYRSRRPRRVPRALSPGRPDSPYASAPGVRAGRHNCLHRDLYGEHIFPIQIAILLDRPGEDFEGGEFVMTEQRPRTQTRAMVLPLKKGDAAIFAVNSRPMKGVRGDYQVKLNHGVSKLYSGSRHTVGVIFHDAP